MDVIKLQIIVAIKAMDLLHTILLKKKRVRKSYLSFSQYKIK